MQQINFSVGNEQKFLNFISSIKENDKIALLSHIDLDGIASAKIVSETISLTFLKLVNYEELNDKLIEELKNREIKKLILTDLTMDDINFIKKAAKEFDVLWIDHHKILEDTNSDKIRYLNPGGNNLYCAAYLCYYLFSKIKNMENYDWLVACACLSDFTVTTNKDWMKSVFAKYGDTTEIKPMSLDDGPIQNLKRTLEFAIVYFKTRGELEKVLTSIGKSFGEIGALNDCAEETKRELDSVLLEFEKNKEEINGRYFFEFNPKFKIGQIVSNTLGLKNPDKTFIIIRPEGERYAVSMRRQNSKEDMEKLMKSVLQGLEGAGGGGHIPAAGGHFLRKDKEKFKERLENI